MASGKLIPIIVLSFYVGLFISIVDTRNTYNHEVHSSKNTDNVSLLNYQILFYEYDDDSGDILYFPV